MTRNASNTTHACTSRSHKGNIKNVNQNIDLLTRVISAVCIPPLLSTSINKASTTYVDSWNFLKSKPFWYVVAFHSWGPVGVIIMPDICRGRLDEKNNQSSLDLHYILLKTMLSKETQICSMLHSFSINKHCCSKERTKNY